MIDTVRALIASAGEHVPLLLACVLLFAAADAALGLGVLLPGETVVVLAAVALADDAGHVALAVASACVGAFVGDQVGFGVGRVCGTRLDGSRLVDRLGRRHWDAARGVVGRRLWVVVVARLLPGVRTFVSCAAGASTMSYRRFAVACAASAALWSTLWVVGGAVVGTAFLDLVEDRTGPVLVATAAAATVAAGVHLVVRRSSGPPGTRLDPEVTGE